MAVLGKLRAVPMARTADVGRLCACGCGLEVAPGRRFRRGHWIRTAEARRSLVEARPSKLTPEVHHELVAAVAAGQSLLQASGRHNVHLQNVYSWLSRGRAGRERYVPFHRDMEAAKQTAQQRRQTPLGQAITARIRELGLTRKRTVAIMGLGWDTVSKLTWKRQRCIQGATCEKLAAFLGRSRAEIKILVGQGTRHPWDRRTEVPCDYCGEPVLIPKSEKGLRHHFCNRDHHIAWSTDRKPPPRLPPSGKRTGRHAAKAEKVVGSPSDRVLAEQTGVSVNTVRRARHGCGTPTPLHRYGLERAGVLPASRWPPLAEVVLLFCLGEKTTVRELAARAGIQQRTLGGIIRTGRATRRNLEKLAVAIDCPVHSLFRVGRRHYRVPRAFRRNQVPSFTDDEAQQVYQWRSETPPVSYAEIGRRMGWRLNGRSCSKARNAFRYAQHGVSIPRRPGRRSTVTRSQAMEVRRLRDAEDLSWPEIGRRMGWTVKRDRFGRPSDCKVARNAYATTYP